MWWFLEILFRGPGFRSNSFSSKQLLHDKVIVDIAGMQRGLFSCYLWKTKVLHSRMWVRQVKKNIQVYFLTLNAYIRKRSLAQQLLNFQSRKLKVEQRTKEKSKIQKVFTIKVAGPFLSFFVSFPFKYLFFLSPFLSLHPQFAFISDAWHSFYLCLCFNARSPSKHDL